jgi:hypothetical protein
MIQFKYNDLTLVWLMSTFSSILNKYYKGFMVLEIRCSFLGSFCDSFPGSSLSPSFPYDLISEFEPPNYLNFLILLDRFSMRMKIL